MQHNNTALCPLLLLCISVEGCRKRAVTMLSHYKFLLWWSHFYKSWFSYACELAIWLLSALNPPNRVFQTLVLVFLSSKVYSVPKTVSKITILGGKLTKPGKFKILSTGLHIYHFYSWFQTSDFQQLPPTLDYVFTYPLRTQQHGHAAKNAQGYRHSEANHAS